MSIKELREFLSDLHAVDVRDDAAFKMTLNRGLDFAETTDADFAETVGVSRPTVTRWRNGQAVPHPALRPSIFTALKKRVERVEKTVAKYLEPVKSSARRRLPAAAE